MERNVRSLYRFLVFNYHDGDEIYLFGFSRGAFTIRTLVGFMNKFGLLEKDDEFYTPEIYELYESSTLLDSPKWIHAFRNIKGTRPCPPIHFIGVWDTVGALGAPGVLGQVFNRNKYKYHDIGLHATVRHAYHALAIDERRKPFAPSLWQKPPGWTGTLEQVWFAGVHSNIGGGYRPDGLANEALHWIVEKAEALGLEFDKAFLQKYLPCFNSTLNNSMSPKYRLFGEHVRALGEGNCEALHQSAVDRMELPECAYEAKNLRAYRARPGVRIVSTARIARGTPCPTLPTPRPVGART